MYREETVGINELYLDPQNYRIDWKRYNTEEKAVIRLFQDEDIMGMIKGIVNHPGLFPHDKMIVIPKDGGGYKVLEGNRRLLAAKCLLRIIKPPAKYEREISSLKAKLDDTTLESLKNIGVVIYDPNDKSYLKILADKHSSISYQRWGQISQWHFFKDLYDLNEKNLDLTAEDLGKSKSDVSDYIKFYNLFDYIRSLPYWDENDLREQIESNTLKATKFTRPIGFKLVMAALGVEYTPELELKPPDSNKELFDLILCKYAEASLIKDTSDDEFIYTRSKPEDVVDLIDEWKKEAGLKPSGEKGEEKNDKDVDETKTGDNGVKETKTTEEKSTARKKDAKKLSRRKGRKPKYWGNLECNIRNDRLEYLSDEISRISVNNFPGAAIMLSRALIESCLFYQINKHSKWEDFKKTCKRECTLESLISYAFTNKKNLFKNPNLADPLKFLQGTGGHRQFMNSIMHDSPISPTPAAVEAIAGDLRQLIKSILADEE